MRFHQVVGYPIYKYIQNLRRAKFTKKLLGTVQAIFEPAMDLGLNDTKNVTRHFKETKSYIPLEYRHRIWPVSDGAA